VCSSFESKAKPIDRRGSIDCDGQPHGTRKVTVAPYPFYRLLKLCNEEGAGCHFPNYDLVGELRALH
jgi:hypothetical protein